ncbi:MAG: M20/M25/M40 family metallo-hydrolase [Balneola sp.]
MLRNLFFVFLAVLFIQCQSEPYEFSEESSAEILKYLSSDELRGRQAFTEDIDKAAEFLSDEFDQIGLDYLNTESDYHQKFDVLSIRVTNADITVGESQVPVENYFVLGDSSNIEWSETNEIEVIEIAEGENFQQRFNELRDRDTEAFIFVDQSHETSFKRYQPFFSRASRVFSDDQKANKVFVLTSQSSETSFSAYVTKSFEALPLANVVGKIEGNRKDEYVVFSAHYDHIGIRQPAEADADSIGNGANDNASGTTAVVELAKYFKSKGTPERTLLFVAFTAEEAGGYGSRYFSKQLDPEQIVAMFNIEMIGKPAVEGPNTAWITGFEKSSFGELLQKSAEGTIYEFYPDPYPNQNLFYRSDNATLARLGVPAHTISTTPIDVDPDYHQVSDEFSTIDVAHLTNTIRAISKAAVGIVSGEDTPTRVDPSQLN